MRFLTAALLLILFLKGWAQRPVQQTVVLNDGSRFTGTIISDSSGFIRIRIMKPRIISINPSMVAYIEKASKRERNSGAGDYHGYNIKLSANLLAGNTETGKINNISLHFSNAILLKNGLSIGIGTGYEKLEIVIIPLYADLRYHPFKSRVSPFVWLKCGHGFSASDKGASYYDYIYGSWEKSHGGFLLNPGFGLALYSWRRNAITIGLGYRFQRISYTRDEYVWIERAQSQLVRNLNRIELQMG
ncbi:MAG: hypothetical protein ACUVTX_04555, partial [Bacteroidales bacterium]